MEQRGTEFDLRAAAERLRLALAAGQLGDWSWNAETDQVTFGAWGADIFGLHREDAITWTSLRERLHPEDAERARLAVISALDSHSDYSIEYRVNKPNGEQAW